MKLGIADKRVLITGGSKGIGASIAKQFLEEGAYISLISRNADNLQKIFKSCGIEKDSNHDFHAVDLREKDAPANITRAILAKHKFVAKRSSNQVLCVGKYQEKFKRTLPTIETTVSKLIS